MSQIQFTEKRHKYFPKSPLIPKNHHHIAINVKKVPKMPIKNAKLEENTLFDKKTLNVAYILPNHQNLYIIIGRKVYLTLPYIDLSKQGYFAYRSSFMVGGSATNKASPASLNKILFSLLFS